MKRYVGLATCSPYCNWHGLCKMAYTGESVHKYSKLWKAPYLPMGVWRMMSSSGTTPSGSSFVAVAAMALPSQCEKFSGPAQIAWFFEAPKSAESLLVTYHSKIHAGQTDGGKHGLSHAEPRKILWFFSCAHFQPKLTTVKNMLVNLAQVCRYRSDVNWYHPINGDEFTHGKTRNLLKYIYPSSGSNQRIPFIYRIQNQGF